MPANPLYDIRAALNVRTVVMAALLLTYTWRFHDLAPFLGPLRLAALASVSSWAMLLFQPRAARLGQALRRPYVALLVFTVCWGLVSAPLGLEPGTSIEAWFDAQLKTLLMFAFLLGSMTSLRAVRTAMLVNVGGAAAVALFYVKGGFPLWGSPVPMYDVNDMALHFNMTLPFVLYFAFTARRLAWRAAFWVLLGILAVCILMTQSRGGFLTLGVLVLLTVFFVQGVSPIVRGVLPVLLVVGFLALPEAAKTRLSTLFNPTADYNFDHEEGRVEIWKRALGYMRDRPLSGVGLGNFPLAERTLSQRARDAAGAVRGAVTHNSFFEVGAEAGFPAMLTYVAALAFAVVRLRRLRAGLASRDREVATRQAVLLLDALTFSVVAFCINGFFLSLAYIPLLFAVFAMAVGVEAAIARTVRPAFPWATSARGQ